MHLLFYTVPKQQRHVVRLLFLVPIYAGRREKMPLLLLAVFSGGGGVYVLTGRAAVLFVGCRGVVAGPGVSSTAPLFGDHQRVL